MSWQVLQGILKTTSESHHSHECLNDRQTMAADPNAQISPE